MIILGIDPGSASGAFAIIDSAGPDFVVGDIPIIGKGRINSQGLASLMRNNILGVPEHCFLENARTMPKQGISSSGRYMHAAGKIEAVVEMLDIPLTLVEANVWKKALNLRGKDKEAARMRAVQLYPRAGNALCRKKDHGRAEALLIARYGLGTLMLEKTPHAINRTSKLTGELYHPDHVTDPLPR